MKVLRNCKKTKLLLCLALSLSVIQYPLTGFAATTSAVTCSDIQTSNLNSIDAGIGNLNYNPSTVIAVNGDTIQNFVPKEGHYSDGKYIVVERNKKSLTTSPVDISIVDSMTDRTYPGALQLANEAFAENQPSILMCARKPLNISIDLPGMQRENTVTVQNPTYGNISGAIDGLVTTWNDKYSSTHTLPARMQYSESMVYSQAQIASALNVNAKVVNDSLGIDFNAIANGEKKVMVAAYKQIFYTVSAELPNNPSDLFGDNVTYDELTRKGVSNSAPPVMVSNVAYGRTIYVKLETTSKSDDVQAAFKALLTDANVNVQTNQQYKDIFQESSFTAVVLGGDAQEHNKVITTDFDQIRKVITDNATFSAKNPAYPISYTSVFLKDNAVAAVHNKTDYIETTSKEYTQGNIALDLSGAFVAQFEVSWDEFSYDNNGQEVLTHRTWSGNDQNRTAHFCTTIPLPANSKNIKILARECTGLAWEWWRTAFDQNNVPLSKNIKVSIWGTTLYPQASISYQ